MYSTNNRLFITYVPADCGSIIPGKVKAPSAFQASGIIAKLKATGVSNILQVDALSEPAHFRPVSPGLNGVRDEDACVRVCKEVSASISESLELADLTDFHLILGGECSMLPGVLKSYFHEKNKRQDSHRVGLIYIDADTDLYSPLDSGTGTFAGMNMTNLLRTPGALVSTQEFVRPNGEALCNAKNTVFFGTNMGAGVSRPEHIGYLFDNQFRVISAKSVARNPGESALQALEFLEDKVDEIIVHLDVDAIDPVLFPLANVPNFTGTTFEQMMSALNVLVSNAKVSTLSIAEVNPDHDPDLSLTEKLTDAIVATLGNRFALGAN